MFIEIGSEGEFQGNEMRGCQFAVMRSRVANFHPEIHFKFNFGFLPSLEGNMNFKEMKCGVASSHQSTTGLPIPPPSPEIHWIYYLNFVEGGSEIGGNEMRRCQFLPSSPPWDELLISLKRKFEFWKENQRSVAKWINISPSAGLEKSTEENVRFKGRGGQCGVANLPNGSRVTLNSKADQIIVE